MGMKARAIKSHLKPYPIAPKRKTTIHHAFASALAPVEEYDEARIREALAVLGQRDFEALTCVYCDKPATTWDHLEALVRSSRPSGFGHTIGNLVPACRHCNSERGNKAWEPWMEGKGISRAQIARVRKYHEKYVKGGRLISHERLDKLDSARLAAIESQIVTLMEEADRILLAARLNNKLPTKPLTRRLTPRGA